MWENSVAAPAARTQGPGGDLEAPAGTMLEPENTDVLNTDKNITIK